MKEWFGHQYEKFPFQWFSISHYLMIIILITGSILLYIYRDTLRSKDVSIRMVFFFFLVVLEGGYHYWMYKDEHWDLSFMLPLHLCSISLILCLVLLFTSSKEVFQIVYFIGIIGAGMAIITPELLIGFPHFRYFHFFLTHIVIIWTCLFYVFVYSYKPTKKGMTISFLFLNGCAVVAFIVNSLTGGNYMFLVYKPLSGSLLDFLGPYPYYLFFLEGMALVLFYLIWLPFKRNKK